MNSNCEDAILQYNTFNLNDQHCIGDILRKLIRLDIEYGKSKGCEIGLQTISFLHFTGIFNSADIFSLAADIFSLAADSNFTQKVFRFTVFNYILFGLIAETRLTTQSDNDYNNYGYNDDNHDLSKKEEKKKE